ncbi:hypothetical protein IWW42_004414 [Coemansia sp. RSA 1085]|nr:hypothetical protein LPJ68_005280 [Coemansia sp. RSA 1086]KAJ2646215.1 hypothetical protein IWW40_005584 [Coemansia sp. RSA 1250]KAJ2669732.1 hypothetical protein IWW42_004414 [Coemansia sp. RSA 1085]
MQQSVSRYEATSQSPVPSLTNGTSQLSSASSSVNTLSPDVLTAARDLLPRFEATRDTQLDCKHAIQASEDTRKRRRESATEQSRKRPMRQPRQRQTPTGSTDFVAKCGLTSLYDEFVRPYVGETRRALPDLATAYLKDVDVEPRGRSVDLLELVLGPAKNDFEKLDLLPRASIKAAFRIGAGSHTGETRRSRVSLKMSDTSHKRQKSGPIKVSI